MTKLREFDSYDFLESNFKVLWLILRIFYYILYSFLLYFKFNLYVQLLSLFYSW